MTRRKRRNHGSAFKAKVALAAVKGERDVKRCCQRRLATAQREVIECVRR